MITNDLERIAERGPHRDPVAVVEAALNEAFTRRSRTRLVGAIAVAAVSAATIASCVVALAVRERGAGDAGSMSAATADSPVSTSRMGTSTPLPVTDEVTVPGAIGCKGFEPRYIGNGLTVALPPNAVFIDGQSTADPGPIHAATSMTFGFGDVRVEVGRRIGGNLVDEPGFAQRIDGGVLIFVRTDDTDRAGCVLASLRYDVTADETDE